MSATVTPDGRYVAFQSWASNLVPGDANGKLDVFVRDLQANTTERISIGDGTEGNANSTGPAITPDGRYVAFSSLATNLVAGDTNTRSDVFVRDRQAGTTERVSVAGDGTEARAGSQAPAISADGRFVAFDSWAWNLVSGDANDTLDVFVRDRQAATTERVSVAGDATQANGASDGAALSADGSAVAFRSSASNLVSGDTNGASDVFVRDRQAATTERVSVAGDATQANGASDGAALSADGSAVAFRSSASNLVSGDTNGASDVFVRDRGTTSETPPGPTEPDLTLAKVDRVDPVQLGENITYDLTVKNVGDAPATSVTITDPLPTGTTFIDGTTSQGSGCSLETGTVTCSLGEVPAGAGAGATIVIQADAAGTVTNTASVGASEADANPGDNEASATTEVTTTEATGGAPNDRPMATWQTDGKVDAIVYDGNVVYLGGDFTRVRPPNTAVGSTSEVVRRYAAAFNATTGDLLPWNPDLNGPVRAIDTNPGHPGVYLGGAFTSVRGLTRGRLAAIEPAVDPTSGASTTGLPTSWNPNVYSEVKALVLSADNSKIYVGGIFLGANGETRRLAAAFYTANRNLVPEWNPNVIQYSGTCPPRCYRAVYSLQLSPDGQSVYIGGTFAEVKGVPRNSAARVAASDASVLPWNPNVYFGVSTRGSQNSVYDMAVLGTRVYLCGDFFRVGGDTAENVATNIAAVDAVSGARDRGFVTSTDGAVNACAVSNDLLYLGGHFDKVGGTEQGIGGDDRQHLAALDPVTGANDPWNPGANSVPGVYAFAITPSRVAVGGTFTHTGKWTAQQGFAQYLFPS